MKTDEQPPLPGGFEYRLDLRDHVTPRLLKEQPVHRWFWFPHSFSPQLIDEILKAFPSPGEGKIFDPFVGAGTTVVRAGQLGRPAVGTDLSPLSVFVSRVKLMSLSKRSLQEDLRFVLGYTPEEEWSSLPQRLQKAFTHLLYHRGCRKPLHTFFTTEVAESLYTQRISTSSRSPAKN